VDEPSTKEFLDKQILVANSIIEFGISKTNKQNNAHPQVCSCCCFSSCSFWHIIPSQELLNRGSYTNNITTITNTV